MDVLLVVDMQEGLLRGAPKHDLVAAKVVAVADCHTVSDRPHLSAARVIDHHQWVWANLIAPHPVTIVREAEVEVIDVVGSD